MTSEIRDDAEVLRLIAEVLRRDGGSVAVNLIVHHNTRIRNLLGDQKLLKLLRKHPEYFSVTVLQKGDHCADLVALPPDHVAATVPETSLKFKCHYCKCGFTSRNKMMKHVQGGESGGERCREKAVADGMTAPPPKSMNFRMNELVRKLVSVLEEAPERTMPLKWLASHRRVRPELVKFVRSQSFETIPDEKRFKPLSVAWWHVAMEILCTLVESRPSLQLLRKNEADGADKDGYSYGIDIKAIVHDIAMLRTVVVRLDASVSSDACDHDGTVDSKGGWEMVQHGEDAHEAVQKQQQEKQQEQQEEEGEEGTISNVLILAEGCIDLPGSSTDSTVVAVYKPSGCRTEALISALQRQLLTGTSSDVHDTDEYRIRSVSRLDQPTSGVIVVPLSWSAFDTLKEHFANASTLYGSRGSRTNKDRDREKRGRGRDRGRGRGVETTNDEAYGDAATRLIPPSVPVAASSSACTRRVRKVYVALVEGATEPTGEIRAKLMHMEGATRKTFVSAKGKEAHTVYRTVQVFELPLSSSGGSKGGSMQYSLLEVSPVTGRTHQIRAHMAHIGHPVAGDRKYQQTKKVKKQLGWCPRLFLHAKHVELWADVSGSSTLLFEATADLPSDLEEVLSQIVPVATTTATLASAPVISTFHSEHGGLGGRAAVVMGVVFVAAVALGWFARHRLRTASA
jgi:23S rRNA-/tRNA-specific pseudouridylate synthase